MVKNWKTVNLQELRLEFHQDHQGHCLPFLGLVLMPLDHCQPSGYSLPIADLCAFLLLCPVASVPPISKQKQNKRQTCRNSSQFEQQICRNFCKYPLKLHSTCVRFLGLYGCQITYNRCTLHFTLTDDLWLHTSWGHVCSSRKKISNPPLFPTMCLSE